MHANIYDVMDARFVDRRSLAALAWYTRKHWLVFDLKKAKEDAKKVFLRPLRGVWGGG